MAGSYGKNHYAKKRKRKVYYYGRSAGRSNAKLANSCTNSPNWLTETKSVNVNYNTCSSLVAREKGYKTRVNWIFNSSGQITIIGMSGKEFLALCDKLISEIDPDLSDDEDEDINDGSTFTLEEITTACKNIGYDLTCGACAELFFTGISMHKHDSHCPNGETDNEFFVG